MTIESVQQFAGAVREQVAKAVIGQFQRDTAAIEAAPDPFLVRIFLHLLALLGSDGTLFNRLNRLLFRRPALAGRLYPWLVRGRLATLALLGRRRIGAA